MRGHSAPTPSDAINDGVSRRRGLSPLAWLTALLPAVACSYRPLPLRPPPQGTDAGPLCGGVTCPITSRCEDGVCRSRITEFPVPADPWDITSGPDGNLWFTESDDGIGRMAIDGRVTEFPVALPPGALSVRYAWDIAAGPDGNLWFAETDVRTAWIARMTPTGAVDHFALPAGRHANAITMAPDGNLWFVHQSGGIGRVTPGGDVLEISWPDRSPRGITVGPDGALWLTDYVGGSFVGRFDPGAPDIGGPDAGPPIPEFPLSTAVAYQIVTAPDGGFWLSETVFVSGPRGDAGAGGAGGTHSVGGRIAHRAAGGAVVEFATDTGVEGPGGITVGPDGNLWFTDFDNSRIGRITQDGVITELPLPSAPSYPRRITTGPDGNLWFTENRAIGRLVPP